MLYLGEAHLKIKHPNLFKSLEESNPAKSNQPKKRAAETEQSSVDPKQRKLEDCAPANQQTLNKAIDDAIVDFLADSGVAFRVVGLASFDKLMKLVNRRINLEHPTTYSRLIKIKAAEIKQDIVDIIAAVKGELTVAAFTTDMWTSNAGNPFMSLTIHFISTAGLPMLPPSLPPTLGRILPLALMQ